MTCPCFADGENAVFRSGREKTMAEEKKESVSGENAGSGTDGLTVPAHVAMILDGNGRWAKKRGLPGRWDIKRAAKRWKR